MEHLEHRKKSNQLQPSDYKHTFIHSQFFVAEDNANTALKCNEMDAWEAAQVQREIMDHYKLMRMEIQDTMEERKALRSQVAGSQMILEQKIQLLDQEQNTIARMQREKKRSLAFKSDKIAQEENDSSRMVEMPSQNKSQGAEGESEVSQAEDSCQLPEMKNTKVESLEDVPAPADQLISLEAGSDNDISFSSKDTHNISLLRKEQEDDKSIPSKPKTVLKVASTIELDDENLSRPDNTKSAQKEDSNKEQINKLAIEKKFDHESNHNNVSTTISADKSKKNHRVSFRGLEENANRLGKSTNSGLTEVLKNVQKEKETNHLKLPAKASCTVKAELKESPLLRQKHVQRMSSSDDANHVSRDRKLLRLPHQCRGVHDSFDRTNSSIEKHRKERIRSKGENWPSDSCNAKIFKDNQKKRVEQADPLIESCPGKTPPVTNEGIPYPRERLGSRAGRNQTQLAESDSQHCQQKQYDRGIQDRSQKKKRKKEEQDNDVIDTGQCRPDKFLTRKRGLRKGVHFLFGKQKQGTNTRHKEIASSNDLKGSEHISGGQSDSTQLHMVKHVGLTDKNASCKGMENDQNGTTCQETIPSTNSCGNATAACLEEKLPSSGSKSKCCVLPKHKKPSGLKNLANRSCRLRINALHREKKQDKFEESSSPVMVHQTSLDDADANNQVKAVAMELTKLRNCSLASSIDSQKDTILGSMPAQGIQFPYVKQSSQIQAESHDAQASSNASVRFFGPDTTHISLTRSPPLMAIASDSSFHPVEGETLLTKGKMLHNDLKRETIEANDEWGNAPRPVQLLAQQVVNMMKVKDSKSLPDESPRQICPDNSLEGSFKSSSLESAATSAGHDSTTVQERLFESSMNSILISLSNEVKKLDDKMRSVNLFRGSEGVGVPEVKPHMNSEHIMLHTSKENQEKSLFNSAETFFVHGNEIGSYDNVTCSESGKQSSREEMVNIDHCNDQRWIMDPEPIQKQAHRTRSPGLNTTLMTDHEETYGVFTFSSVSMIESSSNSSAGFDENSGRNSSSLYLLKGLTHEQQACLLKQIRSDSSSSISSNEDKGQTTQQQSSFWKRMIDCSQGKVDFGSAKETPVHQADRMNVAVTLPAISAHSSSHSSSTESTISDDSPLRRFLNDKSVLVSH